MQNTSLCCLITNQISCSKQQQKAAKKQSTNCYTSKLGTYQGLMQKEKVYIDCEKCAWISMLGDKIATLWWPNII